LTRTRKISASGKSAGPRWRFGSSANSSRKLTRWLVRTSQIAIAAPPRARAGPRVFLQFRIAAVPLLPALLDWLVAAGLHGRFHLRQCVPHAEWNDRECWRHLLDGFRNCGWHRRAGIVNKALRPLLIRMNANARQMPIRSGGNRRFGKTGIDNQEQREQHAAYPSKITRQGHPLLRAPH